MLRTLYKISEAQAELQRICDRIHTDQVTEQEVTVREILSAVRHSGDDALLHYTEKFDQQTLTADELRISGAEIDTAYQQVSGELLNAIRLACKNVESFHKQRLPKNWVTFEDNGVVLGKRYTPVARAG
ncbi:MAG: histidinol dehydrogenase, partial [Cyanobacteria bacterium P01_F01_bin.116]